MEGVAKGHLFSVHNLFIVVHEIAAIPMCRTADFAVTAHVFEAGEISVELRGVVPPDDRVS